MKKLLLLSQHNFGFNMNRAYYSIYCY